MEKNGTARPVRKQPWMLYGSAAAAAGLGAFIHPSAGPRR